MTAIPAPSANGTSVYERIRCEILDRIAVEQVPGNDSAWIGELIRQQVDRHQRAAAVGNGLALVNPGDAAERLMRTIMGAGPFEKFFDGVVPATEVTVKDGIISYQSPDGFLHVDREPTCEAEVSANVQRILSDAATTVDRETPIEVCQVWKNRVRASVSIPPVADGLDATFRIYWTTRTTLDQLVSYGSLTPPAANFLAAAMLIQSGGVISGAPGAGKSTLLNALLYAVPPTTNVRIVQEFRELEAPHLPGGRWCTDGAMSLRMLLIRALQFAPQLLVVGETRGAEAYELTKAANAGCGMLTTLHANSARMAMHSLVNAALMAGENVPATAVRATFANTIDFVVHCAVDPLHRVLPGERRRRQVMEIAVVPPQINDHDFVLQPLFKRRALGAPLEFVGHHIPDEFEERLNSGLPDHLTIRDICEGRAGLL